MEGKCKTYSDDPLELVALNPRTPPIILEMLSEDGGPYVRSALARNPSTTEMIQLHLAADKNVAVRVALATSSLLTLSVMERLSSDTNQAVISVLYQNPATPEYIREELESKLDEVVSGAEGYDNDNHDRNDTIDCDDYDNVYIPRHIDVIEHDGKHYDVMDLSDYGGETMYFDEDNGWLTELP